jgi:hypothetical protein
LVLNIPYIRLISAGTRNTTSAPLRAWKREMAGLRVVRHCGVISD